MAEARHNLNCMISAAVRLCARCINLPDLSPTLANSGDVIEDRGDIFGNGVNVAARLEALAQPGGVCVSDAVRVAVGNRVPAEFVFIGEQRVKNVTEPVRAYHVAGPGGGAKPEGKLAHTGAGAALAMPGKPSLVIKPFENLSVDTAQDYFAEGLTKDIGIALVKIPGLFLTIDETPEANVSRRMSVSELGREFGVGYVLTGGVRRHGGRVRVNAELIEAASGRCLWAERFDRELHDLFSIQDEIAEEIVTAMDVKLIQGETARYAQGADQPGGAGRLLPRLARALPRSQPAGRA